MNNPLIRKGLMAGPIQTHSQPKRSVKSKRIKRFVIERDVPAIGQSDEEALAGASAHSCGVVDAMQAENKQIEWEHSYVTGNKTFCIYRAADVSLIHEHAERSGFPASIVTEISAEIGPHTASG